MHYGLLLGLSQSIPKVFSGTAEGTTQDETFSSVRGDRAPPEGHEQPLVDLEPELRIGSSNEDRHGWTNIDLIVSVNAVKLHLYDAHATSESNLKEHGIARFALNDNTLRLKLLSDGSGEAQVVLRSFTMSNTRPGNTKFREIIPAANHDRNQFMVLYTMSGGPNGSALAVLTVDSPQIIFAVDPVIALLKFFTNVSTPSSTNKVQQYMLQEELTEAKAQTTVDFRLDLHDVSICVLESDADPDSQSIKLTVDHILFSQQVLVLALSSHKFR